MCSQGFHVTLLYNFERAQQVWLVVLIGVRNVGRNIGKLQTQGMH